MFWEFSLCQRNFENFSLKFNVLKFHYNISRHELVFHLSCLTLYHFCLKFYIFFISKKVSVIMSSSISTLHNLFSHSGSKVCDPNHYSTLPLWKESTFCCPCLFRFCLPPPYCERQWQSPIFVFLVHQCTLCGKWMNEWMKIMEEWRDHTFRTCCAIGSGQQPSFMTILCAHTEMHDLYGGKQPL